MAKTLPYRPAAHVTHASVPPKLYCPAGHGLWVAVVDPAGHMYPGAQLPEHCEEVTPVTLPNRPAGHGPLHAAVGSAVADPYKPALQLVQLAAPARLNLPVGHAAADAFTEPATQKYPAEHGPVQVETFKPREAPYLPAAHCPLHAAVFRLAADPKVPAGHRVQVPALARL